MEMTIETKVTDGLRKKWFEFVGRHPQGNIFQTPAMYEVYLSTKKYEPVFLAVLDSQGQMLAVLLAVIQKESSGIMGYFSARAIVQGGPLIRDDDPGVLDIILGGFNRIVRRKAIYSQFRNFWDWSSLTPVFLSKGFEFEEHLNILIDLTKSEEQLWGEVHSKRRNEIRRAAREGVQFLIETSEASLEKCYRLLKSLYSRIKLPIPNYQFFNKLFHMPGGPQLMMYTAQYEGEIIGCMLALVYKDRIYDFYAGSKKEFYNKYPNDLIPWEVFKWGRENQIKIFDFGGAGKPGIPYGVRDYKKKFGGEFVNYGRLLRVNKPLLMKMGLMGMAIYRKIL